MRCTAVGDGDPVNLSPSIIRCIIILHSIKGREKLPVRPDLVSSQTFSFILIERVLETYVNLDSFNDVYYCAYTKNAKRERDEWATAFPGRLPWSPALRGHSFQGWASCFSAQRCPLCHQGHGRRSMSESSFMASGVFRFCRVFCRDGRCQRKVRSRDQAHVAQRTALRSLRLCF